MLPKDNRGLDFEIMQPCIRAGLHVALNYFVEEVSEASFLFTS